MQKRQQNVVSFEERGRMAYVDPTGTMKKSL